MQTKKDIRRFIAEKKNTLPRESFFALSEEIFKQVENHPRFKEAHTVLLYYSLPDEVSTHDFVERWSKEKEIILPVVKGEYLELRRYSGKHDLRKGSYGIEEPTGKPVEDYSRIEFTIVPGVAFDCNGNRLGRGKGYYDRLLPLLKSYNIGVCFDYQVVTEVPTEPFDRPMDEVWTESGCLFSKKQC